MVFYAYVVAMRRRPTSITADNPRSFTAFIYNNGGSIRKLSNEGIIKTMKVFYDANNEIQRYSRFITIQADLSDEASKRFEMILRDHPDVLTFTQRSMEAQSVVPNNNSFKLDYFSKTEEEMNWPPQATGDVYEHMEMNWKEFSRTRWSTYLSS